MFLSRVISLYTGVTIIMAVFALPVINAQSCESGQALQNTRIVCSKLGGAMSQITCTPSSVPGFVIEVRGTRPGCSINPELSAIFFPPGPRQRCVGTVVACVTADTPPPTPVTTTTLLQILLALSNSAPVPATQPESLEGGLSR